MPGIVRVQPFHGHILLQAPQLQSCDWQRGGGRASGTVSSPKDFQATVSNFWTKAIPLAFWGFKREWLPNTTGP